MVPSPIKTLLIEDRESDRELFLVQLGNISELSFDVECVNSLAAAQRVLSRQPVELIVADLNLPDSQELETCQRVHALARDLPLIVLTGAQDRELGVQAVQRGAQDYLLKGHFDEALLVRSIQFAIERTRRALAERQLLQGQAEMAFAREIQRRLLPTGPPHFPGFDIAGFCKPAAATGGDYYDYIPMTRGCLGAVVADVTSHGFGPALIMAGTRRLLRTLVETHADLGEVLTIANRAICEDTHKEQFVTAFLARLDPHTRKLVYAGAGHCGFVIDRAGTILRLDSTGPMLGVAEDAVVEAGPPVQLGPGDLLLLVTDGFFEAEQADGTPFTMSRVLDLVRENRTRPAAEILRTLDETVQAFCLPGPLMDDQTAVIVRVES